MEARRLFDNGNFVAAAGAFNTLTDDTRYGLYARFYTGLSNYKTGRINRAIERWEELYEANPTWNQHHEVLYWLARFR